MLKKIYLLLLLTFLTQINAQESIESAFRILVSSLAEGDFEKALTACVLDEYVEKLDYSALINSRKAFVTFDPMPPTSELNRQINRAARIEELARQFKFFGYGFSDNPDILEYCKGLVLPLKNQKQLEDFIINADSGSLKNLIVKKVAVYTPTAYIDKLYQTNKTIYGCDTIRDAVALLELNGKFYSIPFQAFKYGNNWKVFSLYAPALGCGSIPTPKPVTEEEFKLVTENLKY